MGSYKVLYDYPNYASLPAVGDVSRLYITNDTNTLYRWVDGAYHFFTTTSVPWGNIDGVLTNQTDLMAVLNGKQPLITAGTTAQYYRGDKTFQTLNTTAVPEGTNLYWTDARFNTGFSGKTTSNLTEGTNLYYTQGRFDSAFGAKSTSNLTEGTNLYYTNARFDTRFGTKSTSDLVEGSNLYYSDARFDTRLATKTTDNLTEGATRLYYSSGRFNADFNSKTTDNLTEGSTNLFWTPARSRNALTITNIGTGGAATYNSTTGELNIPIYEDNLINPLTGAGAQFYVPRYSGTTSLTPGLIYDNGVYVGINRTNPFYTLDVNGTLNVEGVSIFRNLTGSVDRLVYSTLGGQISAITLGTGLSLSGGILTATGTGSGSIGGTGTSGYIPKFTATSSIGNSLVFDNGTNVGIGTTNPQYLFHMISASTSIAAFRNSGAATGQILVGNTAGDLALRTLSSGDALIFADTAKYLAFGSNGGTERMRLAAGGNLLVGTTTDAGYKLSVAGVINTTNTTGYLLRDGDVAGYGIFKGTSTRIGIAANGNEYLSVLSTGNVGIGTTSPASILNISAVNPIITLTRSDNGTTAGGAINFSATSTVKWQIGTNQTTGNGLEFNTGTGNVMYINPSGNVGIGASNSTVSLNLTKNITGGTTAQGVVQQGTVQSDVTGSGNGFTNSLNTQATAFTVPTYRHFYAVQGTLGAGSTVTNQYGFFADATLVGATNDYGFFGNLPSGANNWNLYMNGTADNYMAGNLGIGTTTTTNAKLNIAGSGLDRAITISTTFTGATTRYGILQYNNINSDVTSNAINNYSQFATQAASFNLTNAIHYDIANTSLGAGSSITNLSGYRVGTLSGATNIYGFVGNIAAGTNFWNLYMGGSANNYLAGNLGIGTTSIASSITGSAKVLQIADNTTANLASFKAVGGSSATVIELFASTTQVGLFGATNHPMVFTTNATEKMRLDATGNLGLGVTTVDAKLQVQGTASSSAFLRFGRFSGFAGGVEFRSYSGSGGFDIKTSTDATNANLLINRTEGTGYVGIATTGGNVLIGTTTSTASALLQVDSTTQGVLFPRMTTTQKNAIGTPAVGLIVYDTTLNKLCVYTGAWQTITSA